jgi:hypothetical protein
MLAAFAELAARGSRTLWGVFGYGSDGELTVDEIEAALGKLAGAAASSALRANAQNRRRAGGDRQDRADGASAIPLVCFGRLGRRDIRGGQRSLKLTPLTTLTFSCRR